MLKLENRILLHVFLLLVLVSCDNEKKQIDRTIEFAKVSKSLIGEKEYSKVYLAINDSINNWALNNLGYYQYFGKSKKYFLDSLLCFNETKNRMIACIEMQQLLKEGVADDIDVLYGEKINNEWFFFTGANIFIPREMIKNHDIHTPLSYQQLHQIALKEVYGGYLKKDGEINEAWFTSHFEGPGWGVFEDQPSQDWLLKGKRFTNKKDFFEFLHLQKARSNWPTLDTIGKKSTLP